MYGINAEQSICVIGLTKIDADVDITASLATNWTVQLPAAVKRNGAIVEFDADIPMAMVDLYLPLEIPNVNNPAVTWQVDSVNALVHTTSQTASSSSSESSDESIHS